MTNVCKISFLLLFPVFTRAQTETPHSFGVKIFGHGKPMILIPGLKGDGEGTYATTIAHYKDHYTCYVITLAGFAGQPPSARTTNVLQGQRDEILQYVRGKQLQKPVLVGFSFGGTLALWIAAKDPALFGPVVDIDGAPYESALDDEHLNEDSLRKRTTGMLNYINNATPAMVARYDSSIHSPEGEKRGFEFLKSMISDTTQIPLVQAWDRKSDIRATGRMLTEITVLDLRDSVAAISSPLLVLGSWNGDPAFTSKEQAETAMRKQFTKVPGVTIVYSDHGKHFLMWNDYDWFIGQIDTFLKKNKG
jgi:N-formylmaleamate deformylase